LKKKKNPGMKGTGWITPVEVGHAEALVIKDLPSLKSATNPEREISKKGKRNFPGKGNALGKRGLVPEGAVPHHWRVPGRRGPHSPPPSHLKTDQTKKKEGKPPGYTQGAPREPQTPSAEGSRLEIPHAPSPTDGKKVRRRPCQAQTLKTRKVQRRVCLLRPRKLHVGPLRSEKTEYDIREGCSTPAERK